MSKICIVDNISINYRLNKENGILIYPFYEDNNKFDKTLFELKKILIDIHKNVRPKVVKSLFPKNKVYK